jgi:hypothetical protein
LICPRYYEGAQSKERWMGHTVCMGEIRNEYRNLIENLNGRVHEGNLEVDWRIILKPILKIKGVRL